MNVSREGIMRVLYQKSKLVRERERERERVTRRNWSVTICEVNRGSKRGRKKEG